MCGILGIARFDGRVERAEIDLALSHLAHRGPDGEGMLIRDGIGIGHRRLSIIDPELGKQPMSTDDSRVSITFNGEIYNFPELRAELESRGHRFNTHSDTEVILHAYEEWGEECVRRFRGMFAFAIVDERQRRIFLARDHFGIKPLYYFHNDRCFAFASEIRALRALSDEPFDMDLQALDQYLWLQYIPAPRSIYKQVKKLLPAHRMSVSFDGEVSGPEPYWDIEFKPGATRSQTDWLAELDHVISGSVKAHLVSDVPFGAFLSGGIDSSAVVAYMAQHLDRPVRTFSIGSANPDYDETTYARFVSECWGTRHHAEIIEPDALGMLPDLVRHSGEPFGDSSIIPTFYVSKLARQHVPMVLSGDGGDELFAGYQSYHGWMQHMEPEGRRPPWKKALLPVARRLMPWRYRDIDARGRTVSDWLGFVNYLSPDMRSGLWRDEFQQLAAMPLDTFEEAYARTAGWPAINRAQYMDLKTYLPYDILTKVDIASMTNSLEVRTPLVDVHVAEFAASMPPGLNIRRSPDGTWQGKLSLKKLMEKYYPEDFVHRSKKGFAIPLDAWLYDGPALKASVRERLFEGDLSAWFNPGTIQALADQRMVGPLWLLLVLQEWLDQAKQDTSNVSSLLGELR